MSAMVLGLFAGLLVLLVLLMLMQLLLLLLLLVLPSMPAKVHVVFLELRPMLLLLLLLRAQGGNVHKCAARPLCGPCIPSHSRAVGPVLVPGGRPTVCLGL